MKYLYSFNTRGIFSLTFFIEVLEINPEVFWSKTRDHGLKYHIASGKPGSGHWFVKEDVTI